MSNYATSATRAGQALRSTIILRNVPRTALTSDVRRMLESYRIENVQNVYLDYHRFLPAGKAYVTFTQPAFAQPAYLQLRNAKMSGMPLDVTSTADVTVVTRSRGVKGREGAMARGAFTGNGADAGVGEHGKNVLLWGLPGKITAEQLKDVLRSFRLASTQGGMEDMLKIESPGRPAMTSRHYVRTASASEAHRMVRHLHMTPLKLFGRQYVVRARIIY